MGLLASLTGKPARKKTTTDGKPGDKSRYRGVELHSGPRGCCEAMRALAGKRFLKDEIPGLPLADCDRDDCQCSYELFDDRRTQNRRAASEERGFVNEPIDNERAANPGRRTDD